MYYIERGIENGFIKYLINPISNLKLTLIYSNWI